MAGDWLKFETATLDKPEVWAIAQDLSIDPDAVVGKLLRVWAWFDQQSTIGNAPSVTKALLDRCAGVTGFCDSVIKAGWMLDDGVVLSLPNFDRHNGNTAKSRALTGKRVKKHRSSDAVECNGDSVTKALPEKRREEKRININTLTSSGDDKHDKIDYQGILDLYHKILPELAKVIKLTPKRKSAIRTCCNVKPRFSELEFWEAYFTDVRSRDYLMGRKKDWKADFDFLTTSSKFIRVIEGSYG